jgi:hypothetical protein
LAEIEGSPLEKIMFDAVLLGDRKKGKMSVREKIESGAYAEKDS